MDVGAERVTFWFGCNMLRHAEMIRLSIMLLERVGYDVAAAGGPAYCCGTAHDHQPHGASNMAARTVARFNDAADKDGRGKVVTWCPSCHMHMADIMAPGNAAAFEIAHITELLADRAERLAPLLQTEVKRRVLLHRHAGACHARGRQRSRLGPARAHSRLAARAGPGASRAHVQCARRRAGRPVQGRPRDLGGGRSPTAATRSAPSSTPATASWRRSRARTACASGTGCTSSPRPWGSKPATPISAGAPAERRTSPPSRGRTRARYRTLVEPELRKPPPG